VTANRQARETSAVRAATASFEALFWEHWPRVYATLVRLVGDPAEAEDLAQETFWRLYQRPPAAQGSVGGWLYRVALNLGYNALRAARRRAQYEMAAGRDALQLDAEPTPPEAAERAAERRRVRVVLADMPPREAQLLVLHHAGLTYKEIAAALEVAPGSVGTLLARAEAEFERRWQAGEAG
jgi:RNA polymerase sigma-70 factor (ECF subfamily)